jgi:hypothetical protein
LAGGVVERGGRNRYYRLAGPEVATAVEVADEGRQELAARLAI